HRIGIQRFGDLGTRVFIVKNTHGIASLLLKLSRKRCRRRILQPREQHPECCSCASGQNTISVTRARPTVVIRKSAFPVPPKSIARLPRPVSVAKANSASPALPVNASTKFSAFPPVIADRST